ncbi:DUF3795 domain-containing protein [Candidatus Microgenomates bacterium]|nr:DUF3795 domain-containing protein [Candidatus Microgenomates bacterium]
MTTKKVSICGLDCGDCPCYLALQNHNDELRRKTAQKWVKEYDWKNLKPEDINCTGCLSLEEPLFKHCKVCEVRKCGLEMKVENCGKCGNYDNCKKIASLHKMIPDGKKVCNGLKKQKGEK